MHGGKMRATFVKLLIVIDLKKSNVWNGVVVTTRYCVYKVAQKNYVYEGDLFA